MASRPNASAQPDPFSDPYDPYHAPTDPIPMSDLSRRQSVDVSQNWHRGVSPDISPPDSPVIGFGASRRFESNPYAPVGGLQSSENIPRTAANSLYSVNTLGTYKTQDEAAQRLVDQRAGEHAQWHVHWITPAIAIVLFVAGVMGAMGHHIFYARLDGKPSVDQLKMVRYGTALAFFVKSTLVGCVVLCYRQRIWRTFRTKAMTMSAIDGLFTATEDPTAFLNWEMVSIGKLATFMAACSW
jgi:uncharacterized membrane protein YgdD (TMEM256/DUF423 family)